MLPFCDFMWPDELLGNYLDRIARLNAFDSIRAVIQTALKCHSLPMHVHPLHVLDHPASTPAIRVVLAEYALTSQTIGALTTLPYWECFFGRRGAEDNLPVPDSTSSMVRKYRGSRLWYARRAFLQACPVCIRVDDTTCGEPYFHRAHQLHGAAVCHLHKARLFDTCLSCGQYLCHSTQPARLQRHCSCGVDLGDAESDDPWLNALHALARFEYQCLQSAPDALSWPALSQVLVEARARSGTDRRAGRLLQLREHFGEKWTAWLLRGSRQLSSETLVQSPLHLKEVALNNTTPKVACALAVAYGMSFRTACQKVKVAVQHSSSPSPSMADAGPAWSHGPVDLPQAKQVIEDYLQLNPDMSWTELRRAKGPASYAVAAIDPQWLDARLRPGRGAPRRTHTLEEDRKMLANVAHVALSQGRREAAVREAAWRALLRDRAWFEQQASLCRAAAFAEETTHLVEAAEAARAAWLKRPGRPLRFRQRCLAIELGLSIQICPRLYRRHGLDPEQFTESYADYCTRALRWSIADLRRSAKEPTLTAVVRHAGLKAMIEHFVQARMLLKEAPNRED